MQWLFATLQTSSHHTMSSSPLDARVAALEQALQHLLANSVPSHFMPGVSKPQDEQEFSPKMKAAEHTSNAEFASLAADTLERIDAEKDESPSYVATEEAPTIDDADDSPTSIAEDKQDLHAAADTYTPSASEVRALAAQVAQTKREEYEARVAPLLAKARAQLPLADFKTMQRDILLQIDDEISTAESQLISDYLRKTANASKPSPSYRHPPKFKPISRR